MSCACPGTAPEGRALCCPQLQGEAGNGLGVEERGCSGSALVQGQRGLITFSPFSGSGPMWEDGNAYASLGLRHGRCDASECLSPQGRGQAEEEG